MLRGDVPGPTNCPGIQLNVKTAETNRGTTLLLFKDKMPPCRKSDSEPPCLHFKTRPSGPPQISFSLKVPQTKATIIRFSSRPRPRGAQSESPQTQVLLRVGRTLHPNPAPSQTVTSFLREEMFHPNARPRGALPPVWGTGGSVGRSEQEAFD